MTTPFLKRKSNKTGIKSVEQASSALIATLRGFKLPESEVMNVVNALNEVSNTAPITFADLTEGLRRVSGTLSQTGTDINETMGLLTGGFAQLRDIEGVSSGLLMVSQRLRGIGEDGEAIDGLAPKLQQAFKEIAGIDISKGNGELRSTYDILSDMAKVFPTLTEEQKQYLGEMAAGNRQVKVLNAILSGWSDVESAVSSALNSQNSALEENAKFMDSIEGKIQQQKSSFQALASSFIDSGLVKNIIDAGTVTTDFFGAFDGFIGKMVGYPAIILAVVSAIKGFTNSNIGIGALEFFQGIGGHTNPVTHFRF